MLAPALLTTLLAIVACSDGGTTTPTALTPASAIIEVDGVATADNILLVAGATVPAEIRFYNSDGVEITGIEDESFAKITFAPTTMASAVDVPGEHFHKSLTAGSEIETGTAIIGFGRDASANDLSFGPYSVTVVAAADIR